MKTFFASSILLLLLSCAGFVNVDAQAKLVLNGANITIANGGFLVLENSAPDAITRTGGQIISEGENNRIKWMMGEATGTYVIPWGFGTSGYLPLSFTKSAGTGTGNFLFSTYRTGWQNSLSLPAGVTGVSGGASDNSAFLIDRFWQINAQGYSVKPALTNAVFGYLDVEHSAPNNTIIESGLAAQRWNNVSQTWNDLLPAGVDNPSTNKVTVPAISASDLYAWWTLIDVTVSLPLHFLAFEAKNKNGAVQLQWTTASEINVKEFDVQKCRDGISFSTIKKMAAKNGTLNLYEINDDLAVGKTFYRIKEVGLTGSFSYSETRAVTVKNDELLAVYPNPVKDKNVFLNARNIPSGNYRVSVCSVDGKLVFASLQTLQHNVVGIKLNDQLQTGMYTITVDGPGFLYAKKIFIE